MDTLTLDEIIQLTGERPGPLVSLYMPTERSSGGGNAIRFKNLLRQTEALLSRQGFKQRPIKQLLDPAWHLHEDRMFWEYQSDGFACFVAPDLLRFYRLPLTLPELVTANDFFHLGPLLSVAGPAGRFYVLALSKHQTRVLYCTRYGARELSIPDMPDSLDYTLRFDEHEKQLQHRELVSYPGGGRVMGRPQAGFHGHGDESDRNLEDLLRYFHEVDNALQRVLRAEQAPVVLAGVDYLLGLYRRASHYPQLAEETLSGNFDRTSSEELHARAWPIAEAIFQRCREAARARFEQAAAQRQASSDLREVVLAAHDGLLELVFLPLGRQQWGRYDPQTRQVELHDHQQPDDHDLLDLIGTAVLRSGGAIWTVDPADMPTTAPVAAVTRYPVSAAVLETVPAG